MHSSSKSAAKNRLCSARCHENSIIVLGMMRNSALQTFVIFF